MMLACKEESQVHSDSLRTLRPREIHPRDSNGAPPLKDGHDAHQVIIAYLGVSHVTMSIVDEASENKVWHGPPGHIR